MNRRDLINLFIKKRNYKDYLEIGIAGGENFSAIICENKESCDPFLDIYEKQASFELTYKMTSDEMFESISQDKKWDIIFIDGLHQGTQVIKDVLNSLKHLKEGGIIICHDSLPYCENVSHFPRDKDGHWNGSVFRAYPIFKELGISFNVINTDEGLGIIEYQKINIPEIYPEESKISYYEIFRNIKTRNEYLNVISVKEAMEKFF